MADLSVCAEFAKAIIESRTKAGDPPPIVKLATNDDAGLTAKHLAKSVILAYVAAEVNGVDLDLAISETIVGFLEAAEKMGERRATDAASDPLV